MPRRPTDFIMSGVAIRRVKIGPAFLLDLLDQIFAADNVRACCFRVLQAIARSDHGNLLGLAQAVRQNDRAANHLVCVARIDAEAQGHDRQSRRTWRT